MLKDGLTQHAMRVRGLCGERRGPRTRIVECAIVLLAISATSCVNSDTDETETSDAQPFEAMDHGPNASTDGTAAAQPRIDVEGITAADLSVMHRAEELLVLDCMIDAGFEYFTTPSEGANPLLTIRLGGEQDVDLRTLTEEDAAISGFDISASVDDFDPATDPTLQYVESLSHHESDRFTEVLLGTDDEWNTIVVEGLEIEIGTGGCRGNARQVLYGDLSRFLELSFLTANLDYEIWQRLSSSTQFADSSARWEQCMDSRGYSHESIYELLEETLDTGDELTAARHHAECLTESDLRQTVNDGFETLHNDIMAEREGEFVAFSELAQDALDNAKAVVRDLSRLESEDS